MTARKPTARPTQSPLADLITTARTAPMPRAVLAARAGVTPQFMADIEAGRRMPSDDVLVRIAAALSLPVARLRTVRDRQRGHGGSK